MSSSTDSRKSEAIAKIEEVFDNIVDRLCQEQPMSITLKYKQRHQSQSSTVGPLFMYHSHNFPGSSPREAWRFAVLFRILGLIHEALTSNTIVSKRNIYYKDPNLFKSQAVVDKYVDIFAYTLNLNRAALNVVSACILQLTLLASWLAYNDFNLSRIQTAAAKGLVVGSLTIIRQDGTIVPKGLDDKPYLVDDPSEIASIQIPDIAWILVVEKESTFRTLASSGLHATSRCGSGIILTAKGYPDISTRSFLRHLSISATPSSPPQHLPPTSPPSLPSFSNTTDNAPTVSTTTIPTQTATNPLTSPSAPPHSSLSPSSDPPSVPTSPPLLILTDHDPDGLAIASVYAHGSANLAHENASLTVPSLRWLGVRSADLMPHRFVDATTTAEKSICDEANADGSQMLCMTARDRKKATSLLRQLQLQLESHAGAGVQDGEVGGGHMQQRGEGGVEEWMRELRVMLFLNVKGEMEGLEGVERAEGRGVVGWVEGRLRDVVGVRGGDVEEEKD